MGLFILMLPCICSFFFLSTFFVRDISTTASNGKFIFGIHVDNDKLYCGIENLHFLVFFFFLSCIFHFGLLLLVLFCIVPFSFSLYFFVKDSSTGV